MNRVTLSGGQDIELKTVFGHRPAGNPISPVGQHVADSLIGKRATALRFTGDDLSNDILYRQGRGEKVAKRHNLTVWQHDVLIGGGPTDGRFIDRKSVV